MNYLTISTFCTGIIHTRIGVCSNPAFRLILTPVLLVRKHFNYMKQPHHSTISFNDRLKVSHAIDIITHIYSEEQIMITKNNIQTVFEAQRILARAEDFIYLLPHPALQNWISNYTITFPNKKIISENYTIIPHGSATLVFGLNGKDLCSNMFGPSTKPCVVGQQANQHEMLIIIEFQPAGLFTFTGVEQNELVNLIVPFELINPLLNRRIAKTLCSACNLNELITNLDRLLLSSRHGDYPVELRSATQLIINTAGNISSKALSSSVYYSERHLNRIFSQYMGMSAKSLSRLVRINKTIRLLRNPHNSITYICENAGFYDLPHFIHDFKSICGLTPQECRNHMSDFYSEISKF